MNAAGQVQLELKTPWRDGTAHLVLSPLEFLQRLAALVPRPRLHLIRYHGVLAPNARLRTRVVEVRAIRDARHGLAHKRRSRGGAGGGGGDSAAAWRRGLTPADAPAGGFRALWPHSHSMINKRYKLLIRIDRDSASRRHTVTCNVKLSGTSTGAGFRAVRPIPTLRGRSRSISSRATREPPFCMSTWALESSPATWASSLLSGCRETPT